MADSSNNARPGTSTRKRKSAGTFAGYEDQILAWLEEESQHEFSDIDDEVEDPTFEPETQRFDEDVISYEENPEPTNVEARQEPATLVESQISSMAIFQRILDMAGINSFVLYESCSENDGKMRRGTFLLNMARDLVMNHMKTRVYNERLPRELRMTISRVLGKDLPPAPPVVRSVPPSGRKLCSICPTKIKRQTKYSCCDCSKPICLQCSKPLCDNCQTKL